MKLRLCSRRFALGVEIVVGDLILLAIFRRCHTDVLAEYPVELGKTAEAAAGGCLRNGNLGVDQQRLHIAHSGHLNIVCYSKSGHIFELMGKVAAAHIEFLPQHFQGQIFRVVGVDVAGDGVNLFLDAGHLRVILVTVAVLVQIQQSQALDKFLMDDQIAHGIVFLCQQENIIELAEDFLPQFQIKAENGNALVE